MQANMTFGGQGFKEKQVRFYLLALQLVLQSQSPSMTLTGQKKQRKYISQSIAVCSCFLSTRVNVHLSFHSVCSLTSLCVREAPLIS